jgi:predicted nucleic acid-binding protein
MKIEATKNKTPQTVEQQFTRDVVLDWNIIQYWLSDKMRDKIMPVLVEMNTANLRFTMSEISIYEAQCRIPVGKNAEAHEFMLGIPRFPIDVGTHLIAGVVASCYKHHEKTKAHASEISLQDIFNASCSIQNNALLITADYDDYPLPFFDTVWRWSILNEKGQLQKICLLQPDQSHFDALTNKWNKDAAAQKAGQIKAAGKNGKAR